MLVLSQLTNALSYCPETGIFRRRQDPGRGKVKAGDEAGYIDRTTGYRKIYVSGKYYPAHRLAAFFMIGQMPRQEVDHINGNREDNRWINLRLANKTENNKNRKIHRNNKLGVKGICIRRGKFRAQICHEGKQRYLGSFLTVEEAKEAYAKAAERFHGAFERK